MVHTQLSRSGMRSDGQLPQPCASTFQYVHVLKLARLKDVAAGGPGRWEVILLHESQSCSRKPVINRQQNGCEIPGVAHVLPMPMAETKTCRPLLHLRAAISTQQNQSRRPMYMCYPHVLSSLWKSLTDTFVCLRLKASSSAPESLVSVTALHQT